MKHIKHNEDSGIPQFWLFIGFAMMIYSCVMVRKNSAVIPIGEMRRVMHHGELGPTVFLDTLAPKTHLYGLGPVEYLSGELTILEGKSYVSRVVADSMQVEESYNVRAPFFVYSQVQNWTELNIPEYVSDIQELEQFLDESTLNIKRPFTFKMEGTLDSALIHIVNLPQGSVVHSPEDAHQNLKQFELVNEEVDLIGYFSKEHAGVFVHHDSFVHIHLVSKDRKKMGHLEKMKLDSNKLRLFIAKN